MQTDAERTLNNLHVLSALSHNDKLMTNEDAFDIYSPTSMRGLVRMWYGERRSANIERVRQTVRFGIRFCRTTLEDTDERLQTSPKSPNDRLKLRIDASAMEFLRMTGGLERARTGLQNLTQTYRDDAASASQMCLLIQEIDDHLCIMKPHIQRMHALCHPSAPSDPSPPLYIAYTEMPSAHDQ